MFVIQVLRFSEAELQKLKRSQKLSSMLRSSKESKGSEAEKLVFSGSEHSESDHSGSDHAGSEHAGSEQRRF